MHSFLKVESLGETRCRKSWDRLKVYDSQSLRYVKQVSGKIQDHRLEKNKSTILIGEVTTPKNLGTGPVKRLTDNSDAPEARRGIFQKTFSSSKRKTRLHSTYPRRNGCSRLRKQKSGKKDSLWWIPELECTWSVRKTFTLLSWRDNEDIKKSDDGKRRGANKRRSDSTCQNNWTYLTKLCFLKKLPQFFPWRKSVRTPWVNIALDQRSETTFQQ